MIEDVDTFKHFSNLIKIEIRMKNGLEISPDLLKPNELQRLKQELFNISNLFDLNISYSEFNSENHQWILPESLQSLSVINSVFEFDLSRCSQLKKLMIQHNELNKMPILSKPPPPLIDLDLSFNPLHELVANDVAKYCSLKFFKLEQADVVYCECVKLIEWIKINLKEAEEFSFKGILECNYVEDQACSKNMLQEVQQLREKCIYDVGMIISWIISIIAFLTVSVLVGFVIAYIVISLIQRNEFGEE